MLHVVHRGGAVDDPGVFVAADDLLFVGGDDEISHHRAHDVVDRDESHDERVFVEDDGKVGLRALEDVERFRERERVGNELTALHETVFLEDDRFFIEHAAKQVLRVDESHYVVEIPVAHEEPVVGNGCNLSAHATLFFVEREENDVFTRRHGGGNKSAFELENVLNHRLFLRSDDAGFGACAHRGENVFRRDGILTLRRKAAGSQDAVGEFGQQKDDRAQTADEEPHRTHDEHGDGLGLDERQALREQIREDDEKRRRQDEGEDESEVRELSGLQDIREAPVEEGGERRVPHDAAQERYRVDGDLQRREEGTGVFLQIQDEFGSSLPVFVERLQSRFAGGGNRNLCRREEGADAHQR